MPTSDSSTHNRISDGNQVRPNSKTSNTAQRIRHRSPPSSILRLDHQYRSLPDTITGRTPPHHRVRETRVSTAAVSSTIAPRVCDETRTPRRTRPESAPWLRASRLGIAPATRRPAHSEPPCPSVAFLSSILGNISLRQRPASGNQNLEAMRWGRMIVVEHREKSCVSCMTSESARRDLRGQILRNFPSSGRGQGRGPLGFCVAEPCFRKPSHRRRTPSRHPLCTRPLPTPNHSEAKSFICRTPNLGPFHRLPFPLFNFEGRQDFGPNRDRRKREDNNVPAKVAPPKINRVTIPHLGVEGTGKAGPNRELRAREMHSWCCREPATRCANPLSTADSLHA